MAGKYVRNSAAAGVEILLYGEFGPSVWGLIDAAQIKAELDAIGPVSAITVRINSPGGDIMEANAIYRLLVNSNATITTVVDGLAASCAGWVAQAGSKRIAAENAIYMLHDPISYCVGSADELRAEATLLDKLKQTITGIFAQRTGKPADTWATAMSAETWYTGAEALAAGLCDELSPNATPELPGPQMRADVARFRNCPEWAKVRLQPSESGPPRNWIAIQSDLRRRRLDLAAKIGGQGATDADVKQP
jgi:ATP-dependent Clp endopeptidase proteolytic subunit ClpP